MLGAYRSIDDYYSGWTASRAIHQLVTHINLVGYWYTLRSHTDLLPDETSQNTAISTAYRMYLTPAFVIHPTGNEELTAAKIFQGEKDSKIGVRRFSFSRGK